MRIGEPFNPRYEACGFHPEEIVSRWRDLTVGEKWLYNRMVRWARVNDGERQNQRAGEVWRSHENMAEELGKSARQLRRDLARLEAVRLIGHRTRDGRRSNTYVFLFHASFERTPTSGQIEDGGEFERTPVTGQNESATPACPVASGHSRPVKCDLSGHPRPTNQKVFNQKLKLSSIDGRAQATTTSGEFLQKGAQPDQQPQSPNWTPGGIQEAREAMQAHFGSPLLPDREITRAVVERMEGPEDVRHWLLDLTSRRVKVRSWGFYRVDAVTWPDRRRDVASQVEAMRHARQRREAEQAQLFARQAAGSQRRPLTSAPTPAVHIAPRCARCQGTGIREATGDPQLTEWCACADGARRRAEEPNAIDVGNEAVHKLRQRSATSTRSSDRAEGGPAARPPGSAGVDRKGLMRVADLSPPELRITTTA